MADFKCGVRIPEIPGVEGEQLTVGRPFILRCEGPWPENIQPSSLRVDDPQEPYRLKLLGEGSASRDFIELKAVSYKAGPHQISSVIVTDNVQRIELGPVQFEVISVLKPDEPKQEPYGPLGPMGWAVPTSWWLVLVFLMVVLLSGFGILIWRQIQRRRILKRLASYDSPLTPSGEFFQKLRRLQREKALYSGQAMPVSENKAIVAEIEKDFLTFFMRRFRIPALEWNSRLILKEFKSKHRLLFEDHGAALKKLLREFAAVKAATQVEARDVIQLTEQTRVHVEKLDAAATKLEKQGGRP